MALEFLRNEHFITTSTQDGAITFFYSLGGVGPRHVAEALLLICTKWLVAVVYVKNLWLPSCDGVAYYYCLSFFYLYSKHNPSSKIFSNTFIYVVCIYKIHILSLKSKYVKKKKKNPEHVTNIIPFLLYIYIYDVCTYSKM